MEKMKMESIDGVQNNIEKIAELFPNCITEALDTEKSTPEKPAYKKAVNWKILHQMLSSDLADENEAYEMTWVGKKAAIVEANKPIRKTLRPCPEESVNWDTTENLYIEGDNLEVLKLLQESYLGKVKMIYIDPPYNTGSDFIYRDSFYTDSKEYKEIQEAIDEEGNALIKNPETNGRFHSDWCSMIYSRLLLARNLLSDDGVIFISLDEKEINNLRSIGDEIFGASNFVSNIIWQSRTSISNDHEISLNHNHTLIYSKNREALVFGGDPINEGEYINSDNDPRGPWKLVPIDANHAGGDTVYPVTNPKTGVDYYPPNGRIWCYNRETMKQLLEDGRIKFGLNDESSPKRKLYLNERIAKGDKKTPSSLLMTAGTTKDGTTEIMNLFDGEKVFDYPKPVNLLKKLIEYGAPNGGVVMDFFSGSGTTAQAVLETIDEKNKDLSFIMVQIKEDLDESLKNASSNAKKTIKNAIKVLDQLGVEHTIPSLAKERIKRSICPLKNKDSYGFRSFKADSSNFEEIFYHPNQLSQQKLFDLESNIKPDRSDLDLFFGCILDWGLPLTLPYSTETIGGFRVHNYNNGDLIACFEENVSEELVKEIASRQPMRVVFRDSSFGNSPEKINVFEIFKKYMPEDADDISKRVKVI